MLDKLDVYIAHCDAVVHLVGDMTGSSPDARERDALMRKYPDLAERLPSLAQPLESGAGVSYTQWDAWLALYHGKLLFVAEAKAGAPRGPQYAPTDALRSGRSLAVLSRDELAIGIVAWGARKPERVSHDIKNPLEQNVWLLSEIVRPDKYFRQRNHVPAECRRRGRTVVGRKRHASDVDHGREYRNRRLDAEGLREGDEPPPGLENDVLDLIRANNLSRLVRRPGRGDELHGARPR